MKNLTATIAGFVNYYHFLLLFTYYIEFCRTTSLVWGSCQEWSNGYVRNYHYQFLSYICIVLSYVFKITWQNNLLSCDNVIIVKIKFNFSKFMLYELNLFSIEKFELEHEVTVGLTLDKWISFLENFTSVNLEAKVSPLLTIFWSWTINQPSTKLTLVQ